MTFACLGWGSLIWDPRGLPVASGWFEDGPLMPLEFARKSNNGRITLVITPNTAPITTLWCKLRSTSMDDAVAHLAAREGISKANSSRLIGRLLNGERASDEVSQVIHSWIESRNLEGVVWTALPPKFDGVSSIPTSEQIVSYLKGTTGEVRSLSEEYIRRAPTQIKTPFRAVIEKELNWVPMGS